METFLSLVVLFGIFVVISLMAGQRSDLNRQLIEADQNSVICERLSFLVSKVYSYSGNSSIGFSLDRPVWVTKGHIGFGFVQGGSGNGPTAHDSVICAYVGAISGDSNILRLDANESYRLLGVDGQMYLVRSRDGNTVSSAEAAG
jgi:hypothetical protein